MSPETWDGDLPAGTYEVREARIQVGVTQPILDDEGMLTAVKREHEARLAAMFRMVTDGPTWGEPEPMWLVGEGEESRLLSRFFVGDPTEPPSLYFLTASQHGVPA